MRLTIVLFVLFALLCLAAAEPMSEELSLMAREAKEPGHHKHHKAGKKAHKKHKGGKKHKGKKYKAKYHKHKGHKKGHKHKHKHHGLDHPSMRALCSAKNKDATKAIDRFCPREKTITIPSDWSMSAKSSGKTYAKINITPSCNPKTKVNWMECRGNFLKVCAMGDSSGFGQMPFGPQNGCQNFHISTY